MGAIFGDTGRPHAVDYAIVKLDNGVAFSVYPRTWALGERAYRYGFTFDEKILIMGEGEEFNIKC